MAGLAAAAAAASPGRADTAGDVQAWLDKSTGASTGFLLKRPSSGGSTLFAAHRIDTVFEPATPIKVLHHLHAMLQVQQKKASLTESVSGLNTYSGSCPTPTFPPSLWTETLEQCLRKMLEESDNARTDAVRARFGVVALNGTAQTLGMTNTKLVHRPGCGAEIFQYPFDSVAHLNHNRLTLRDVGTLYEKAFIGDLLTAGTKQTTYDLMPNGLNELTTQIAWAANASNNGVVPAGFANGVGSPTRPAATRSTRAATSTTAPSRATSSCPS